MWSPGGNSVVAAVGEGLRLRRDVVGVDEPVPVLDGRVVSYVNLDNAATRRWLR